MLEEQDAELFYQLFFPLLDFVNKEYRICPEFETIDEDVDPSAQKVVADYLWAHTRIIDIYLSERELPDEYAQIIAGWKQRKIGTFLLERHLKQGSVFISQDDFKVYMVKSYFDSWEELLGAEPMLLEATLIPFRGSIISDGMELTCPGYLGGYSREKLRRIYTSAKAKGEIRCSLEPKKEWKPPRKKNWEAVKSYVIQVEWAPDCYRHIRIGSQATLITLHKAILDALDFDDDHCYEFYMNDRYRSEVDAYSSDVIYIEGPSECDVTLRQLRLKKGNKFKFSYDFGDEWLFQCKVLQELNENTDAPAVIGSVGTAPEQYEPWDD